MIEERSVILENRTFRLVLSKDAVAESLVLKSNGEECIYTADRLPFFSLTEQRPYNNETKLEHPNKRTTFAANRLRMEGEQLIVGFELIDFEARVDVKITPQYMVFTLVDFIVKPDSFGLGVLPILPPVEELRLIQLPLSNRAHFGEWLNVMWDEKVAVNVLSTCPYPRIASEKRRDHRILYGEVLREVQLKNAGVALIVSKPDELMDAINVFEHDFDLPRGVESRRSPMLNRSYYWTSSVNPETVDEHIGYARKGGFQFMSIYYTAIWEKKPAFNNCGQYAVFREEYKNGRDDLVAMLEKIKAAGIIPGLHILHSHVGFATKYLTPVADHRLNLTSRFTLAKPASAEDTVLYVDENPEGAPVCEQMRVLRFMGELIQYESFSTEYPYCFTGCKRGFNGTHPRALEVGTMGGVLDVSEFGGTSVYVNQKNDLQDELADGIADVYNAGFEFIYFDGSEGTNPPFDINVGLAQWRVYKKLKSAPIFCEGAAKSHFSWHMLSGGNAFDVWSPKVFKEMVVKHPFAEVPHMANDLTRLNFGWWGLHVDQRPDILEYGTALAAACNCPGAFQASINYMRTLPRIDDMLETFRRWELARSSGFVTPAVKAELMKTDIEHTLLLDESGELELAAWEQVKDAVGGNDTVTVFVFERKGKACAALWHNRGKGVLNLPFIEGEVSYVASLGGEEIPVERTGDCLKLPVEGKRYLVTEMPASKIREAFVHAQLEEGKV